MEQAQLADLPALERGIYRHYKGGQYEVIGLARHSESGEAMVIYRPLYNSSGWWVRPWQMFTESVNVNGVQQARFSYQACQQNGNEYES